jgi:hypothetical protein
VAQIEERQKHLLEAWNEQSRAEAGHVGQGLTIMHVRSSQTPLHRSRMHASQHMDRSTKATHARQGRILSFLIQVRVSKETSIDYNYLVELKAGKTSFFFFS